ncbi:MAG: HAD family hydrolase [Nanoarchaeota archaeon]
MAALKQEIKLIIFDFDGTIVDSRKFHINGLINSLRKEGFRIKRSSINKLIGKKTKEILKDFHINKKDKIKKLFKDINDEKRKNINMVRFIGKSKNIIKNLQKYHLVIISNAETNYIKEICKKEGIKKYFKEILGAEKFKNKETAIKKLAKKYNYKKNQIIFIGDRYSDILLGERAGITTIAISNKYSWSSKKSLLKQNPDFLIYKIEDVEKIIKD